jgi:hypothetical protein
MFPSGFNAPQFPYYTPHQQTYAPTQPTLPPYQQYSSPPPAPPAPSLQQQNVPTSQEPYLRTPSIELPLFFWDNALSWISECDGLFALAGIDDPQV